MPPSIIGKQFSGANFFPGRKGVQGKPSRRNPSTLSVVMGFCGPLFLALSIVLLVPLIVSVIYGEYRESLLTIRAFVLPSLLCLTLGFALKWKFPSEHANATQATLICSIGWLVASGVGALPFVIGIDSTYLDGYFEAMSGFTTTGITMYTGLDVMPKSILFWRALTQWVGGLGIITMFLAVSPKGGLAHHLFGAEGHKINVDRPVPGVSNTIKILLGIYILFTVLITISLWMLGMPLFESLCHSFAALATGGYSPHDASIEYYRMNGYSHYIGMEYVLIVGMIIGGMSFVVHYRVLSGFPKALFDNAEVRYWWAIISAFTLLIVIERLVRIDPPGSISLTDLGLWLRLEEDFRLSLFQVVSIITTTGFGTRDIMAPYFGEGARQLFLVMMVIGGCVGSTGGGVKVLRIVILNRLFRREVYRQRVPAEAITTILIDGEQVDQEEIYRVGALFFGWIVLLVLGGGVTEFLSNHTGYAALSGMFSALGNVGPCFISIQDITQLHPAIKIVYIMGMLAGRLEILPVFLLFSRKAWRSY